MKSFKDFFKKKKEISPAPKKKPSYNYNDEKEKIPKKRLDAVDWGYDDGKLEEGS